MIVFGAKGRGLLLLVSSSLHSAGTLVSKRKFLVSLELSATAELKLFIHLELFQFSPLCSYEAICPIHSTTLEVV